LESIGRDFSAAVIGENPPLHKFLGNAIRFGPSLHRSKGKILFLGPFWTTFRRFVPKNNQQGNHLVGHPKGIRQGPLEGIAARWVIELMGNVASDGFGEAVSWILACLWAISKFCKRYHISSPVKVANLLCQNKNQTP
jgi:hypothetical protein